MLSANTILDGGKIILGMIVGGIAIFFNQSEKIEMKNNQKFLGLRTAIYRVNDLQAARKWYTNVFETEPYFNEEFYVGFSIGGYELGLLPGRKGDEKSENVLTYWGVRDIESTYKFLLENGASGGETPNDVGDGIMVAHVLDPWGNALGIIFNPHFRLSGEDVNGQIVEWAPYDLIPGVSERDLFSASDKVQTEFLEKQKGFIRRELLKQEEGKWVDVIYWESGDDARIALKNAEQSPACADYFRLMNMSENPGEVSHLKVLKSY